MTNNCDLTKLDRVLNFLKYVLKNNKITVRIIASGLALGLALAGLALSIDNLKLIKDLF